MIGKRLFIAFLVLISLTDAALAASHHPQDFLKQIAGTKDEGKQIVEHFCSNCHASKPLISVGAPRMEELNDWKMRIAQGIKVLLQHTDEGINAMPPRGGCFECTDQQLILAILAMLPEKERIKINSDTQR